MLRKARQGVEISRASQSRVAFLFLERNMTLPLYKYRIQSTLAGHPYPWPKLGVETLTQSYPFSTNGFLNQFRSGFSEP